MLSVTYSVALPLLLFLSLAPSRSLAGDDKQTGTPQPPKGYVEMVVGGVMETEGGRAVVLKEPKGGMLLPIWVGEAEAFSINLRLKRHRFQRPLTHDLLDAVVQKLGAHLVKVQVDALKENTFIGTIYLRHQGNLLSIDARPSDAISLAVGNQAPVFVAEEVLQRAGIRDEEGPTPSPPDTSDPEKRLKDILQPDTEDFSL